MRRAPRLLAAVLAVLVAVVGGGTGALEAPPRASGGPGGADVPSGSAQLERTSYDRGSLDSGSADRGSAGRGSAGRGSFNPGLIVSDDNFFDYFAMSAKQVQRFLERQACEPRGDVPCLADYRQNTRDRPDAGPGQCGAYAGASNERASRIIWRVAHACRISPRTLLVLLQKEQSLIAHPSAAGYSKATGYGCPDTADCDAAYLGFFNQVYRAAWQFREYTRQPSAWRYHVGTVLVQYHPDASCGASRVRIRNQATANLYNYTPYQPNAQTLAHPDGPAGPCSAYGNLNFSRIWHRWFGSPLTVRLPDWLPPCLRFVNGLACRPLELPPRPEPAH